MTLLVLQQQSGASVAVRPHAIACVCEADDFPGRPTIRLMDGSSYQVNENFLDLLRMIETQC